MYYEKMKKGKFDFEITHQIKDKYNMLRNGQNLYRNGQNLYLIYV